MDREARARLHEQYLSCGLRNRDDTGYMRRVVPGYELAEASAEPRQCHIVVVRTTAMSHRGGCGSGWDGTGGEGVAQGYVAGRGHDRSTHDGSPFAGQRGTSRKLVSRTSGLTMEPT